MFSQETILESAGEREEDFEALKKLMWAHFKPTNPLEEMLVTDVVVNYWRRQRVRRCETTELNNRLKAREIRERLDYEERVASLKKEFFVRLPDLFGARVLAHLCWDGSIQKQLASTSLGMDYLIFQMRSVVDQVNLDGYMSKESFAKMQACGIDGFTIASCQMWSSMAEEQLNQTPGGGTEESLSKHQSQEDTDQGVTKKEKRKPRRRKSSVTKVLVEEILKAIASLEERKKTLESVEQMEGRARSAETFVSADSIERFSRAETAFERRMYRALGALLSLRGAAGRGMNLPELPE